MAMQLQSPSSSSFSSFTCDFSFDVFISFRGTDTRFGFTGNLYKALTDKGIRTFIDDKELQRGDEITPSLLKSIEDSRIAIIVFSKEYASSSFCLDELVHIIHYFKEKSRLVLPIFYGTEPSHVRKLSDSYGEALAKHEEGFQNNKENLDRLLKWKKALNQAANLSGQHFNQGNEYERDFIEKIVTDVSNKINHVPLHVADYLVGLESRISKVNSLLELESNDGVCMIGILGTGGMGKTTLAEAVYNLIADQFECKCFLHNVRETSVKHGIVYLQEQLLSKSIGFKTQLGHVNEGIPIIKRRLSQKKVLLILDDVDKREQLNNLVGEPGWLGPGSRVIITTRDKQLLSGHRIRRIYEAGSLNKEEALELLRKVACKSNKNDSSYDYILNRAVEYASGLPLALEVVASNLFGKSIAECECLLDKYERIPHEDIQKILKVSYDALDEEQQSVFLDIACFFKGRGKEYVQEALHDHYGYCIESHIGVLVDKSLVKIYSADDGGVTLHDLIENMGTEIVRQESIKEPGERSRLWFRDDIINVLQENKGTSKIEMINMNFHHKERELVIYMNEKAFKMMTNLKTLIIQYGHFAEGPKYLPRSLRVLKCKGFTSESLSSCFSNKKFNNMKILTLAYSEDLTHIPDVSGLPNLEKLSFQDCYSLTTIHNSVGYLIKLEILDAMGCSELKSFPPLCLPSLKELKLSFCKGLKSFPELLCKMTNIKSIRLEDTSIEELPFSFVNLTELRRLTISSFKFKILSECLSECHHLWKLNLDYCKSLEEIRGIPLNLEELSALECESLSSSSRRMLMSQKLHEDQRTSICFPIGREGIPDWFEHQSRGDTISFWFRKKIPSITCIFLIPQLAEVLEFNLFVNGNQFVSHRNLPWGNAILFDLKLDLSISMSFERNSELYEAFKINEWNYVELNWKIYNFRGRKKDDPVGAQMGIHVLWKRDDFSDTEESNTEGDVVFTNPYRKRRKFHNKPRKQRAENLQRRSLEETKSDEHKSLEVSETESLQPQYLAALVPGMHNMVLTETKERHGFQEVGVSETEASHKCSLEETRSDEDKSFEVSETETVDVILSIAQMGIHEKSNTTEDM